MALQLASRREVSGCLRLAVFFRGGRLTAVLDGDLFCRLGRRCHAAAVCSRACVASSGDCLALLWFLVLRASRHRAALRLVALSWWLLPVPFALSVAVRAALPR